MLQRIIGYLNVIWDDAEELERLCELSHPRIVVETAGLSANATRLANRLAETIGSLNPDEIARVLAELERGAEAAEARNAVVHDELPLGDLGMADLENRPWSDHRVAFGSTDVS